MLGVHINTVLDFREHHTYITKEVKRLAATLSKRKLRPTYKTLIVKQLLKSKYHAVHLGVFNDRQLTTIVGILNKAMRQAIGLLPNFPTEGVQGPFEEADLGLAPIKNRATHMGIEHLIRTMNKNTERGFTTHTHFHRIISQLNHWPTEALETTTLKLPTLRILRLANTVLCLELENLPGLQQDKKIATNIKSAS